MEIGMHNTFSNEVLDKLCPFYFILDSTDCFVETGSGFNKLSPGVIKGTRFYDFFAVKDSADSITQQINKKTVCVITKLADNLAMKVNPIPLNESTTLYVGYPVLTAGLSLKSYNLTINDLPQHDYMVEFLFMFEGMKRSMFESEQHVQTLASVNKKLRQNNVRYLQTEKVSLTGSWYWNFAEEKAVWSEVCCQIYCLPENENIYSYDEWLAFIHPEDLPLVKQKIDRAELDKSNLEFTSRIVTKCGNVKYVHHNIAYDFDGAGNAVGFLGTTKDVSEQFLTNAKLAATNTELERYKNAVDGVALVSITNAKGIITHVNELYCQTSKYSREELVGASFMVLNSACHTEDFLQQILVTVSSGKTWKGEVMKMAKDGTPYWVDSNVIPFMDEQGQLWQFASICYDVTDRKKAEEKIVMMNAELELRVKQRTKELEQKNNELESFAYTVSHDLRSPLRMINSYATLVAETVGGTLPDTHSQMLKNIKQYSAGMNSIISDLLNLARIGSQPLVKQRVSLNSIAEVCVHELKNETGVTKAHIVIGALGEIDGDKGLLRHALTNLISNALKYSAKVAEPRIEISRLVSGNNQVVYYVKDNGAGFDSENASRLFKPFQRLHSREDFDGTGVGLSIVHSIVTKHGGNIWAESKENEGATFYFTLDENSSVQMKVA